jgi:NTE family protein
VSTPGSRIALVLPGGGARGGYEVGALSVLLPALEARGEKVSVVCGTSVGAINAAFVAATAHLPAQEQVGRAVSRWQGIRRGDVMARLVGPSLPLGALRLAGDLAGLPGVRYRSLMDASPLRGNLERWVDWGALHRNVQDGVIEAACVVASSLDTGSPVGFVEQHDGGVPERPSEDVAYVAAKLAPEHVRASAAIPMLFPAVQVRTPESARGFYVDGATRLNSPIKPAIDLGADRVIVVGFEPVAQRAHRPETPMAPHLSDIAANMLDGLLFDQVVDDMHRLAAVNSFFADGLGSGPASASARAYRAARGRQPYRRIAYALVTPERRRELGRVAEDVFKRRYGGLRGLRDPDFLVLGRLLASQTESRGELLSFLLFDEEYVEELIRMGRRDARRWLESHPAFWCADSAHDFDLDPRRAQAETEAASLEEWRTLRRR